MNRKTCRTIVILLLLTVAACSGVHDEPGSVPQDLRHALDTGTVTDAVHLIQRRYEENLGTPFPDIELTDSSGVVHRLSEYRGESIVLVRVSGCGAALELLGKIEQGENVLENGYRNVFISDKSSTKYLPEEFRDRDDFYLIEYPMVDSFLAYSKITPEVFYISSSGDFVGFRLGTKGELVLLERAN